MSNMNDKTVSQNDKEVTTAYELLAARNGFSDCRTYADSLNKAATSSYWVMPNGTVEFLR